MVLIMVSILLVVLFPGLQILSEKPISLIGMISGIIFTILVMGLFVWIWTTTFYIIDKEILKVKSGPFNWQISIRDIQIIRLNQNTAGGIIKPTLSWKCIEIEYGEHKVISISPINQDRFIGALLAINKQIEVKTPSFPG